MFFGDGRFRFLLLKRMALMEDLAFLKFERGNRGDAVAFYGNKVCLVARGSRENPQPGEGWVCSFERDGGKFYLCRRGTTRTPPPIALQRKCSSV